MNKKEFLQKLKALFKEYNASIVFTCDPCSDTYGIYDEGMSVRMNGKEVARNSCWSIDATDL